LSREIDAVKPPRSVNQRQPPPPSAARRCRPSSRSRRFPRAPRPPDGRQSERRDGRQFGIRAVGSATRGRRRRRGAYRDASQFHAAADRAKDFLAPSLLTPNRIRARRPTARLYQILTRLSGSRNSLSPGFTPNAS
jgi:hypothetical protein